MAIAALTGCIIVALLALTSGYPNGAPEEACVTMVPDHPNTTTSGTPPYKITLSKAAYTPGSQIKGLITSPNNNTFRGFLLQARAPLAKNASLPVGQFVATANLSHTVCGENDMQGLTQNNNTVKASLSYTWNAPASYAGDLVFELTIVESYDPSRYWLNILSVTVLDCSLHASSAECAKLSTNAIN